MDGRREKERKTKEIEEKKSYFMFYVNLSVNIFEKIITEEEKAND